MQKRFYLSPVLLFSIISISGAVWNPPFYQQSNSSWENILLGFGPQTIGQAGCLMTSVTMMVAGEGVLFNGTMPDPPMMNEFLKKNYGYIHGDDFIFDSVNPLGTVFQGFLWTPFEIVQAFQQRHRVILNVMEGGHFVLMTGVGETFYQVMDPYFNRSTYFFQDVVLAVHYTYTPFINNIPFISPREEVGKTYNI